MNIKNSFISIKDKLMSHQYAAFILLLIVLCGATWYITKQISSYEKQLAIAEIKEEALNNKEQILKKVQKDFFSSLEATKNKNIKLSSKQKQIEKEKIEDLNNSKKLIEEVLKPNNDLEKVIEDSKKFLEIEPQIIENKLVVPKEQVQAFIALKIDHERLQRELEKTKEQLLLEKQINTNLNNELTKSIEIIESTNKTMKEVKEVLEAYKTTAKKSKWRIIKDYTKQAAVIGISAYIGSKLGN